MGLEIRKISKKGGKEKKRRKLKVFYRGVILGVLCMYNGVGNLEFA